MSGVETAYRSLVKQGKIPEQDVKFIAFGGDGGTYDIGIQALSGALERGHKMMYVCYNNEAYMNTGIQRSSATPLGASTTTSPAGKVLPGKMQFRKDLTAICAAHNIPYVAQSSPHNWRDLMEKARKASAANGPSFLNVLADCNRGWRHATDTTIDVMRLAVETCYWPLYEVENGKYKVNYQPREKKTVRTGYQAGTTVNKVPVGLTQRVFPNPWGPVKGPVQSGALTRPVDGGTLTVEWRIGR